MRARLVALVEDLETQHQGKVVVLVSHGDALQIAQTAFARIPVTAHRYPIRGRSKEGYLEKGIQTPMARGRSTSIISMIHRIRTSRLPMKNTLSHTGAPRLYENEPP